MLTPQLRRQAVFHYVDVEKKVQTQLTQNKLTFAGMATNTLVHLVLVDTAAGIRISWYQESRAEEELVVDAVSGFHFGEVIPQRAHYGQATCVCMPEEGVDIGQQNVASANGIPDAPGGILQRETGSFQNCWEKDTEILTVGAQDMASLRGQCHQKQSERSTSPNSHGSRRFVSRWACPRKNG